MNKKTGSKLLNESSKVTVDLMNLKDINLHSKLVQDDENYKLITEMKTGHPNFSNTKINLKETNSIAEICDNKSIRLSEKISDYIKIPEGELTARRTNRHKIKEKFKGY